MKKISVLALCWLALALFSGLVSAHAADGSPVWTNYFNGTGNAADAASAIAVDGGGNVYVTGASAGSGSDVDYLTIKYSAAGAPLWTNRFSSPDSNSDQPIALALDGSGNVYITGVATYAGTGWDWLTLKYSSSGVALWTNRYNGPANGEDFPGAMAVDATGNVYVTGSSLSTGIVHDFVTIKYSTTGVALWTNRYNGPANDDDWATGLAVDTNGNVYVTGLSVGIGSSYDYATIKYSTAGVALWTNRFNGSGNDFDRAVALALDTNGNVFVTGYATGSGTKEDWLTIKYSPAGIPSWTNIFNGPANSHDGPNAMAVDRDGNVLITGSVVNIGFDVDWATIKYSNGGTALWTNIVKGAANQEDYPAALAVDSSGNVYVTGIVFDIQYFSSGLTIKYSPMGATLWTNVISRRVDLDPNAYVYASAMALDANGNVYVTGFSAVDNNSDFVTIKYSGPPAVLPPLSFVTTNGAFGFTNNQFVLTLTGPAGSNAIISASTDLQSWVPLLTNQLSGGTLQFTDMLATNYLHRFYRAKLQ